MFFDTKENELLSEYKTICEDLNNYEKLNNLINRKIELTFKVLNSKSFKKSISVWAANNPEELISIYMACKSESGFIITYGTDILGGVYLDFCESFLTLTNNRYSKKYTITNLQTSNEVSVKLNDIIEHYTSIDLNDFKLDLDVKPESTDLAMSLIKNNFVRSANITRYGIIQVDPIVKHALLNIIEEFFTIKVVEDYNNEFEDKFDNLESLNKVVPLFTQEPKVSNR